MVLYSVLVEDNFGVGQPVAYFFIRDENTQMIMMGLEYFAKVLHISICIND